MSDSMSSALNGTPIGYANHKFIYDENNNVIDYRFIDCNDTYLKITGFSSDIIGMTILEYIPNIHEIDTTNWISLFGSMEIDKKPIQVDLFSEHKNEWYHINAYLTEPGYFSVHLSPFIKENPLQENTSNMSIEFLKNKSLIRIMAYQAENFEDFLDYALEEAIRFSSSKLGYIYLYDQTTKTFKLNSWSKDVMDACSIIEKQTLYSLDKTGFWGEVVRQGKAIINNNFSSSHPLKKGYPKGHAPLHKFMSIPIFDRGHIVAVIGLANKKSDYTENDILQVQSLMEIVWDAAKRKQAEDALAKEKETLRITLESLGDGVFSIDQLGNITSMNAYAELMTGFTRDEAIGNPISDILFLNDALTGTIKYDLHDLALLGSSYNKMNLDIILTSKNGKKIYISDNNEPIFNENGHLIGAVIVLRDVTESRKKSEEIIYMNYHDSLTGLYNRRFFEEELKRLDTHRQLPLSIILGDVNGLKLTNDVFGHNAGDQLLKDVADLIKDNCRSEDIVARWGGDEFVLLLPRTSSERADAICQKIKMNSKTNKQSVIDLSISLGYATKENMSQTVQNTLKLAEDFMYRHKLTESQSQRSNIINAIQNSLEERNHETEAHAERLIEYSNAIGKALQLSDEVLDDLKLFALLHDIGKIGIPDHILLKPGPLDKSEWHEMKKHPEIGYRIAQSSPDLSQIADYILTHHERWDGTGYPHNLQGKEIPLPSRILSVVDAYDAMTSDRPYRRALKNSVAIQELKDYAGTQFDPTIVSIFLNYMTREVL